MHCQNTEDQCLGNANMYESHAHSILVRISNSTIATSAQHNFIRQWPMSWVAKTSGPSNPTRCQAASAAGKKRSNLTESGPRDHAAALHGLFYLALQVICPIWWTYPCSPTAFHGFSMLSMPRHHRNHDANGSLPMPFLDYPNNSLCYLQKLQEVRWTTTRTSPNFGWKIHLTPTKPAKENHDHPQTSWKLWHATPQINPPYAGGGCCWWVLEVFQYNMRSTLHQIIKSLCLIARIKAWPWRKPWTSAISSKQVAELPWAPKCRHNGTVWT